MLRRILAAGLVLALSGVPLQAQVVVKIATVNAGDNPRNIAANEMAKLLNSRSNGRIKAEVYLNNQLAKGEAAMLEGIQLGTIDIAPVGAAPIGGIFEPAYLPLSLPFLWPSRQHVWQATDGALGAELTKKIEAKNVKVLCFGGGWGYRNVMSNTKAIKSPADMKGMTIRVQQSSVYIGMMKALGANPVPMPWSETYLALKQGTVDAMEAPAVSIVSDKYHEIGKYYSLTKHTYEPITWFVGKRLYEGLSPELKTIVDEAAKQTCTIDRKAELDSEAGDLETIKKAGVQVTEVPDTRPFRDLMKPVYDEVGLKVGKEWLNKVTSAAN